MIAGSLPIMLDVNRPGPDYTLRWPRELFVQEARVLLADESSNGNVPPGQVEWLLEEASASSSTSVADFRSSTEPASWDGLAVGGTARKSFLQTLIDAAPRLPELTVPRPYYAALARREIDLVCVALAGLLEERRSLHLATFEVSDKLLGRPGSAAS